MEFRMRAWHWWTFAALLTISSLILYQFRKGPMLSQPLMKKPLSGELLSREPRMLSWELDLNSGVGSIGAATSLIFLPDGETLAVGSEDLRVRSWDVKTGQLKGTVSLKRESLPGGS